MRILLYLIAISFLSCGHHSSSNEEPVKKDSTTVPPDTAGKITETKQTPAVYNTPDEEPVNVLLKAKFGTKWHVLNDQEAKWMKDAFDYFIVPKRKENPNYPYITKGDFNDDSKQDIAAVVTDSTKENFRVAVLLSADNIVLWDEDIMIDAALSVTPKSTVEGMEGEKTKKVKLKGDGINVEYFEKASFVLYWDKSSFKRIQTGD